MKDPLTLLKRISNPYAVSLFEKDNKRILLLGDVHTPSEKDCKKCNLPTCGDYLQIIKALDMYHKENNTELDVFVETYSVNNPKSLIDKAETFGRIQSNSLIYYLMDMPLHLIDIRKELLSKIYFHKENSKQRYHYFDFRFSKLFADFWFNVVDIIRRPSEELYNEIHRLYPTKTKYINTVKQFCFSRHFIPSYSRRNLLSHDMTRIAKQFYKLPPAERVFVKEFVVERMNKIMKKYDFDSEALFNNIFQMITLMTDTYSICRFVRYHMNQVEGSTTVLLAGAFHTYTYSLFLKKWKAQTVYSHRHTLNDIENLDIDASRCTYLY